MTKTYTIGEVEEISGVKSHILRYWEEVVPSISPKKTVGGHRFYTENDLEIILQLKFYIYEKKFTIEGARNQVLMDTAKKDKFSAAMTEIREIRKELSDLYLLVRKYR